MNSKIDKHSLQVISSKIVEIAFKDSAFTNNGVVIPIDGGGREFFDVSNMERKEKCPVALGYNGKICNGAYIKVSNDKRPNDVLIRLYFGKTCREAIKELMPKKMRIIKIDNPCIQRMYCIQFTT